MRYEPEKHRPRASIGFNMAPMIDVVFLLIIFFVLVSTFATAEHIPLELPAPEHSQARDIKLTDRVIINVQLADPVDPATSEILYSVGPNRPESLGTIARRLKLHKRSLPDFKVVIRADRRAPYDAVREVMQIIAENEIAMMSIAAMAGDWEPRR